MKKPASLAEAAAIAQFKLAIISPVLHELYPDSSRAAYYERITDICAPTTPPYHSGIDATPSDRYRDSCAQVRRPQSGQWLDECFFNRVMRKVNKDSTVSIDKVSYDVPMHFISMKVEIRFLPDDMSAAYILCDGVHYPIRRTNRNENCRTRRDNPPRVDYAKLGGGERK